VLPDCVVAEGYVQSLKQNGWVKIEGSEGVHQSEVNGEVFYDEDLGTWELKI
jgi:hypothetical protein